MDGRDVGVAQGSKHFGFTLESGDAIRITCKLIWQDLNCHITFQFGVSRSVDFAHSTFAEQSGDFERAELLSDLDGHHFYGRIITVDIGANNREGSIAMKPTRSQPKSTAG